MPGAGVLPVRVCDACKISSIASKKGETVNLQSIRAFALHNSKALASGSRPASPALVEQQLPTPVPVAVAEAEDELLQLSRALYADLSQTLVRDKEGEEKGKQEEDDHAARPVRRALFGHPEGEKEEKEEEEGWCDGVAQIPEKYGAAAKLRAAEELAARPGWQAVLEREGVTVLRLDDAFCVKTEVRGRVLAVAASMLDLPTRLAWDEDLDPSGTAELARWGRAGSLQRHLSRQVGPVSARSFVVLNVRCDAGGTVRMLNAGYDDEPELHDPRGTVAKQLPQLALLRQTDEERIETTQYVHLQLGGWLPMSVVFAGLPALLVKTTVAWRRHVEQHLVHK